MSHTIRVLANAKNRKRHAIDAQNCKPIFFWCGTDLRIELSLFDGSYMLDASEISRIIVEIRDLDSAMADPPLATKTYTAVDCNATFTASDWRRGDRQFLTAAFTAAELDMPVGYYRLIVRHIDDNLKNDVFLHSWVEVVLAQGLCEGAGNNNPSPDDNPTPAMPNAWPPPTIMPITGGSTMTFSADGTKFISNNLATNSMTQYSLDTAWIVNNGNTLDATQSIFAGGGLEYSDYAGDGSFFYTSQATSSNLSRRSLITPFDLTDGIANPTNLELFDFRSEFAGVVTYYLYSLRFNSDGTKALLLFSDNFQTSFSLIQTDLGTTYRIDTYTSFTTVVPPVTSNQRVIHAEYLNDTLIATLTVTNQQGGVINIYDISTGFSNFVSLGSYTIPTALHTFANYYGGLCYAAPAGLLYIHGGGNLSVLNITS